MITAYDYYSARFADRAGVDLILVGDSLGPFMLGYPSTVPVTMEEMLHHCRAVTRARPAALVVGDLPFGSYQSGAAQAVANAVRLIKEGAAPRSSWRAERNGPRPSPPSSPRASR